MRQLTDDTFANIGDLYPPDQQAIIYSPSIREFKMNQGGVDPNTPEDAFFYWNLPSQFLGNQVNELWGISKILIECFLNSLYNSSIVMAAICTINFDTRQDSSQKILKFSML